MARFEKVTKYSPSEINLPVRKTKNSAGYDFEVAQDTVIHPYGDLSRILSINALAKLDMGSIEGFFQEGIEGVKNKELFKEYSLQEINNLTKLIGARPTLVPTGIKCKLAPDQYLEISVRSSCPLKYWLVLANGVGIIDSDYYNNPTNEGEIFFQVINLSPYTIKLNKGDVIGQGIIKRYEITEDDEACGDRIGGFGSTNA